jgi:hypothetical protein
VQTQRGPLRDYDQSIGLFEQAIAKDPSFAPAYAGVAASYAAQSAIIENLNRRENLLVKMRAAASQFHDSRFSNPKSNPQKTSKIEVS